MNLRSHSSGCFDLLFYSGGSCVFVGVQVVIWVTTRYMWCAVWRTAEQVLQEARELE